MSDLMLEVAKSGEYTCKYGGKYLYSKYKPRQIKVKWQLDPAADFYVLLGIGLGYEYEFLLTLTHKPIYVVELNGFFKSFIEKETTLKPIYINESDALSGIEGSPQFLLNEHLIERDLETYQNFLSNYRNKGVKGYVVVLEHVVIAKDCIEVFENLGYEVKYLKLTQFQNWLNHYENNLKFLFSVNFQHWLAELAEQLKVPYISWTVDTPSYTVYMKKIMEYLYSYIFHYDEIVVQQLIERGVPNVFYLPVAANTKRFDRTENLGNYKTDVSFVGNSCGHNEYENYIKDYLAVEDQQILEKIIAKQLETNEFVIPNILSSEMVKKIISAPRLKIPDGLFQIMTENELASFFIGRQHSYVERQLLIRGLEGRYEFKLYGDSYWERVNTISYAGMANHYKEMPQIFKESKINVNLIRSFVASGLPMRVFDVLGCGGFLMTNAKADITKYFIDGEHLVIFDDLADLTKKIDYYLNHEEERKQIAKNGYELVKKYHTFERRIEQMLTVVFGAETER